MFNKLSFLPIESVHPIFLSLEDFEDENGNIIIETEPLVTDINSDDVVKDRTEKGKK